MSNKHLIAKPTAKQHAAILIACLSVCCFPGCKEKTPDIVQAGGIVTLNGKPLAHVSLIFIPMAPGLDGNSTANGVSDEKGAFTLSLAGGTEPGCCACECVVLVTEGPMPDAAYVQNQKGMDAMFAHKRKLKNRPIPELYQSMVSTPLKFTIGEDSTNLAIELKR